MRIHKKDRPTPADSRPRYVVLLETVARLRDQARGLLHERVRSLVELFDDADYREKLREGSPDGLVDDLVVAGVLDEFVDDTEFTFLQLRKIFDRFPEPETWRTRKLVELWAESFEPTPDEAETRRPRRTVKLADHEALVETLDKVKAKLKTIESDQRRGAQLVDRLSTERETLEKENRRLRDRIAELETENRELRRLLASTQEYVS